MTSRLACGNVTGWQWPGANGSRRLNVRLGPAEAATGWRGNLRARRVSDIELLDNDLRAACVDAGLEPGAVRLYRFPAPAIEGVRASFLPPRDPTPLHPGLELADKWEVAKEKEYFRIAVEENPKIVATALFRHELEHCVQVEKYGPVVFTLLGAFDKALAIRHHDVRGYAHLRYVAPAEADANATASCFVRARFGDAACDEVDRPGDVLLLNPLPAAPPRSTLPVRQACFAATLSGVLHAVLGRHPSLVLRHLGDEAVAALTVAIEDETVRMLADEAVVATPPRQEADAASVSQLAALWSPAKRALASAYERAYSLAAGSQRAANG
jgi:hypothetical protein